MHRVQARICQWCLCRNLAHYESVVLSVIIFTLAFGQRSSSIANAPAARFSTPTALYQSPTHRAAENCIENERAEAKK